MVILDTNIIIDHLRQKSGKHSLLVQFLKQHTHTEAGISILSVQELYEGRSTRVELKEQLLLSTIAPLQIIPYTYEIAQKAGILMRDSTVPVEFADAAVAATALVHEARLYTLNMKDFSSIKNLQFYQQLES